MQEKPARSYLFIFLPELNQPQQIGVLQYLRWKVARTICQLVQMLM